MSADLKHRVRPGWGAALDDVLAHARSLGPRAVLAFDLDSTLFDNRPRQARIVREYGERHGVAPLAACQPHHWTSGFDMKGAMAACGLSPDDVARHADALRHFWGERFFTSEYCREDTVVPGAAAFTQAVLATGAQLAYVTGRPEPMRAGTLTAMRRHGLALPGERVHLLMKPDAHWNDDAFKREAHTQLGRLGTVIAAFDNEPTHVNDYRAKFPGARVFHLATDHSGRPVVLHEDVLSVPHFGPEE